MIKKNNLILLWAVCSANVIVLGPSPAQPVLMRHETAASLLSAMSFAARGRSKVAVSQRQDRKFHRSNYLLTRGFRNALTERKAQGLPANDLCTGLGHWSLHLCVTNIREEVHKSEKGRVSIYLVRKYTTLYTFIEDAHLVYWIKKVPFYDSLCTRWLISNT